MEKKVALAALAILPCMGLIDTDNSILLKIGEQIYQNETSKNPALLVFWNKHESFPSLGIGHFIWRLTPVKGSYGEFPALCGYLQANGIRLPSWIDIYAGAPWKSREEFYADTHKRAELQELLLSTFTLQVEYILKRHCAMLPTIIAATPENDQERLVEIIQLLQATPSGTYALIDYLHFKGNGIYYYKNGKQGFGLLQVLLAMPDDITQETAPKAFAACAACMLSERIKNSGPTYDILRFLPGWVKRLMTYADSTIFENT